MLKALTPHSRSPLPNGWRLSGEGGEADRVRCSRGLGRTGVISSEAIEKPKLTEQEPDDGKNGDDRPPRTYCPGATHKTDSCGHENGAHQQHGISSGVATVEQLGTQNLTQRPRNAEVPAQANEATTRRRHGFVRPNGWRLSGERRPEGPTRVRCSRGLGDECALSLG
jgi:hypothetical protein